jgi:hypothetical protein
MHSVHIGQLEYLIAEVEEAFTRATERLLVSQPAHCRSQVRRRITGCQVDSGRNLVWSVGRRARRR